MKPSLKFCSSVIVYSFKPLPLNKYVDPFKFKVSANDKTKSHAKMKIYFGMVENILGKGENAGSSIFSFSHNVFKRLISQGH